MTVFYALFRRQLLAYFYSPIAYVTSVVFLSVSGVNFCRMLEQSVEERLTTGDLLFGSIYFWLLVMVSITLITMHVFAEERRMGTMESLLTAPVTDMQVVVAKYAAVCAFFVLMCLPTLAYPFLVKYYIGPETGIDTGVVLSAWFMFLLISGFFIAVGVFMSSLTRSQVVAAILSFATIATVFFSDSLQYVTRLGGGLRLFDYVSCVQHVMDASVGMWDSRPVVMYVSGIALFLFLAIKVLESREWK